MKQSNISLMRKIDLAGLGAVMALTAAAYLIGVEPLVAREAELRARENELHDARQAAQDAAEALSRTRRHLATSEQMLAANPLRLQPQHRLNARLAEITTAAVRHGLQIDQIEPGRATPSEHYVTLPIRVTGRSSYGGATRFLHEVRDAMPDLAVASMELTGEPRHRDAEAKFSLALLWHASPDRAGQ